MNNEVINNIRHKNKGKSNTRTSFATNFKGCLVWVILFFGVIALYSYRYELQGFKQRIISAVFPSYELIGDREIYLTKYQDGHFYLNAEVVASRTDLHSQVKSQKIARIKFLVDTGASGLTLSGKDALNMGIDLTKLTYDQKSYTANGPAYYASITLDRLVIGGKIFYNVRAHVSSSGLNVSLLGMSILNNFSDVRFLNDQLVLKY